MKKHLVDKRKSLALFAVVFILYSLVYMTKNCYSAAMASIVEQGIMTKSQTGTIAAAFYLIYAPFQVIGGIAADKFSPHKLILLGIAGGGVCNLLVYFLSENYIAMLIIWSFNAAIQFGVWPSVFKIMVSELAPEHRTRGVYFINFSVTAGLMLSYVTASFIDKWQNNFLFSTFILFALFAIFFIFYRSVSKSMVDASPEEKKTIVTHKKTGRELFFLVLKSGVPILLIVYVIQSVLHIGLKALAPVMLLESYDEITAQSANLLNVIIIIAAPVGLLIGGLPIFKKFSYPTVIAMLFGISIPLVFVMTFIGEANLFVILVAFVFISLAMSATTTYFSYCSKTFEKYGMGGVLSGMFNCMSSLGLVLANYVFMKVAESFGWEITTKVWFIMVIFAFLLVLVALKLWGKFMRESEKDK